MATTDRGSVTSFLEDLRKVLQGGGKFYLVPRTKNRDSLLSMGLTIKNCRQEIFNLRVEDYCSGPDIDADPKYRGTVWTFGKEICDRKVYIKVKVTKSDAHQAVTCISFHEAEYPLRNVYR